MPNKDSIRSAIRKNYAGVAQGSSSGCCGGSCCCSGKPVDVGNAAKNIGYTEHDLANAPSEANMGLGCGNPVAIAMLKKGETVLDLGSGGGLDCFLALERVGDEGYVIGVDMTQEMIQLARKNAERIGRRNIDFRLGEIEHLPVADVSVDVILSNCVINLALDKQSVFREAFRVLKPGGRLSISDVVATKPLPESIKSSMALISSCVGGAEYVENIRSMLQQSGFRDIVLKPKDNSGEIVKSWSLGENIEDYVASYDIQATRP